MLQTSRFYRLRSRFWALNDINDLLPLKSPFFFKKTRLRPPFVYFLHSSTIP